MHETSDEDGHKLVHTSRNFDATEQLPADNCPINNGTAADESPIDNQQEISFGTTSVELSSANTPPHNNAYVPNAYMKNDQDKTVVNFEPTETDIEQEGVFARATNNKINAATNNSVNQTQVTSVNSHELLSSKLTGIFTTINEGQMLDKEVRNLLHIFNTSLTLLHQKLAGLRNQIKKLDRFNMNLKKEMKNNQRMQKHKFGELFGKFNAFKQETAQICQHIDGDGGSHQEDRDFIHLFRWIHKDYQFWTHKLRVDMLCKCIFASDCKFTVLTYMPQNKSRFKDATLWIILCICNCYKFISWWQPDSNHSNGLNDKFHQHNPFFNGE